jgi:hypothetical protein
MTLIGWGCSPARFRISCESAVGGLAAWRLDGMLCIKSIKCYFKSRISYFFLIEIKFWHIRLICLAICLIGFDLGAALAMVVPGLGVESWGRRVVLRIAR